MTRPSCRASIFAAHLGLFRVTDDVMEASGPIDAHTTDVIVIGGGPVGLCMVLQLAFYGIRSVLIETAAETRWHPKGNTNNARTLSPGAAIACPMTSKACCPS